MYKKAESYQEADAFHYGHYFGIFCEIYVGYALSDNDSPKSRLADIKFG